MRWIDADALMADCQLAQEQASRHGREFANAFYSGGGEISTEWWCVEDMIENAPTIETQPKTGKWIKVHGYCTPGGDPVWACSECGKGIHVYGIEHGSYGRDVSDGQWKACPNCGARMVKEGEAE